jgi:hypothetical protein
MGIVLSTSIAAAGACGSVSGDEDAAVLYDAAVVYDAAPIPVDAEAPDAAPATAPSATFQTSGGGKSQSASYRATIQIGAPQPMGKTASPNFKATLGPNSKPVE